MTREQPVLVGTTSIETSELLSGVLKENGIAHEVLNAKQHEREAHIVENAGMPGKVTIATNMAGRGTDIKLGGNNEAELEQAAAAAGRSGPRRSHRRAHPRRLAGAPQQGGGRRRPAHHRHRAP